MSAEIGRMDLCDKASRLSDMPMTNSVAYRGAFERSARRGAGTFAQSAVFCTDVVFGRQTWMKRAEAWTDKPPYRERTDPIIFVPSIARGLTNRHMPKRVFPQTRALLSPICRWFTVGRLILSRLTINSAN